MKFIVLATMPSIASSSEVNPHPQAVDAAAFKELHFGLFVPKTYAQEKGMISDFGTRITLRREEIVTLFSLHSQIETSISFRISAA
jgi:hypothetical protein